MNSKKMNMKSQDFWRDVMLRIWLLIFICPIIVNGCASPQGQKEVSQRTYLDKIIESHLKEAKDNNYTYEHYFELTKPFGIWDVRPRNEKGVMIGDRLARPGDVSHYHFGMFSAYFKIPQEKTSEPLDNFLMNVQQKSPIYKEAALRYAEQMLDLVSKVIKNNHKIFIYHEKFQRVDDVFFEKDKYWKYEIEEGSPFVVSDKRVFLEQFAFSQQDKEILKDIKDLGLYGAVHTDNAVFLIADGMLNYSYGYMFSPLEPELVKPGSLFENLSYEKIHPKIRIYFFWAN